MPVQPAEMAQEPESTAAVSADPFPLPRRDPRTGQPVISDVVQESAEQPDMKDGLVDAVAPEKADVIRNLIERLGAP